MVYFYIIIYKYHFLYLANSAKYKGFDKCLMTLICHYSILHAVEDASVLRFGCQPSFLACR